MAIERVTSDQRRIVFARANGRCEYCCTPEKYVPISFEVEHIIPRMKGGKTILSNLALSCPACNSHKFCKLTGTDPQTKKTFRLFNPRRQKWEKHFVWNDDFTQIIGTTPTGRATISALQMNHEKMVNHRRLLIHDGLHPPK